MCDRLFMCVCCPSCVGLCVLRVVGVQMCVWLCWVDALNHLSGVFFLLGI